MNPPASLIENAPTPLAVVHATLHRLAKQSAACKWISAVLVTAVLLYAVGREGNRSLFWAAAPAALLALMDAASVVESRRAAKSVWDLSTKEKTDPAKAADVLLAQAKGPGYPQVLLGLGGIFSFSVWPYYLALAGITYGVAHSSVTHADTTTVEAKSRPSLASTSPSVTTQVMPYPPGATSNPNASLQRFGPGQQQRPMNAPFPPTPGAPGTTPRPQSSPTALSPRSNIPTPPPGVTLPAKPPVLTPPPVSTPPIPTPTPSPTVAPSTSPNTPPTSTKDK